jgi:UDP-N-acetylmuramoyl-tripeptide--D-alanyl-D-alanine ligase
MDVRPIEFIVNACGGRLLTGDPKFLVTGISIDSRKIGPGFGFIAIKGKQFDGHDFVSQAVQSGAAAVIYQTGRDYSQLNTSLIEVSDTLLALNNLSKAYRRDFNIPFIAVGGSNGKTTTKELISFVLEKKYRVLKTPASFNNNIGIPLTLLELNSSHNLAVIEVGTNHPGELRPLLDLIEPSVGIITSIGREHLEFFDDLTGVIEEESEIAKSLDANGLLILNGDNQLTEGIIRQARSRVLTVGFESKNDWRVKVIEHDLGHIKFLLDCPLRDYTGDYIIHTPGKYNAINATFAIVLASEFGITKDMVQTALLEWRPVSLRMNVWKCAGITFLDDSYNANPDSMSEALRTLGEVECEGRRVAVLGQMAELGRNSDAMHWEIGKVAAENNVDIVIAIGQYSGLVIDSASLNGVGTAIAVTDINDAVGEVYRLVRPGDIVLLKGSRVAKVDELGQSLRQVYENNESCSAKALDSHRLS